MGLYLNGVCYLWAIGVVLYLWFVDGGGDQWARTMRHLPLCVFTMYL